MKLILPLFLVSALFVQSTVHAQTDAPITHPYVESIEGTAPTVTLPDGTKKALKEGDDLSLGQEIETPKDTSLRIAYPDESVLTVDDETKLTLTQNETEKKPEVILDQGSLQAKINKAATAAQDPTHRFFIRTKSAVLGVRGTEFIANADANEFHTLEGSVAVAANHDDLKAGKGETAGPNEMIQKEAVGTAFQKKPFDRTYFLRRRETLHPRGAKLQAKKLKFKRRLEKKKAKKAARTARRNAKKVARATKRALRGKGVNKTSSNSAKWENKHGSGQAHRGKNHPKRERRHR